MAKKKIELSRQKNDYKPLHNTITSVLYELLALDGSTTKGICGIVQELSMGGGNPWIKKVVKVK